MGNYQEFHEERHAILRGMLERYLARNEGVVLDVGGGGDAGGFRPIVEERGLQYVTADTECDAEKAIRKGVNSIGCNVDGGEYPFSDSAFLAVIFASVIEHLYNPRCEYICLLQVSMISYTAWMICTVGGRF